MAKDDYHVLIYQILAYLYTQLKRGEAVDPDLLKADSEYLGINQRYWIYIFENLLNEGYIRGPSVKNPWGQQGLIMNLENAEITPKGIEYLCDNSFLEKAVRFLKETKSIVPFI